MYSKPINNNNNNQTACAAVELRWAKLKLQKYTATPSHLGSLFDFNVLPWVWFQLAFTLFTTGWASIWGMNYCGSPSCDSTAFEPCGWHHHQSSVIRNKNKSFLSGRLPWYFSLTSFFFFLFFSGKDRRSISKVSLLHLRAPRICKAVGFNKCCRNTFTAFIGYFGFLFGSLLPLMFMQRKSES